MPADSRALEEIVRPVTNRPYRMLTVVNRCEIVRVIHEPSHQHRSAERGLTDVHQPEERTLTVEVEVTNRSAIAHPGQLDQLERWEARPVAIHARQRSASGRHRTTCTVGALRRLTMQPDQYREREQRRDDPRPRVDVRPDQGDHGNYDIDEPSPGESLRFAAPSREFRLGRMQPTFDECSFFHDET